VAFVEHIPVRWASNITVQHKGEALLVRGRQAVSSDVEDIVLAYSHFVPVLKPLPGEPRGGSLPPHVQFANAMTDDDLIAFVRKYGPVNGNVSGPGPLSKDRSVIDVVENLQRLRKERNIIARAFGVLAALRDNDDIHIATGLADLMHTWSQQAPSGTVELGEKFILDVLLRARTDGFRDNASDLEAFLGYLRGRQAQEYGWYFLSVMLNYFPPLIVPTAGGLVEMPHPEKSGILPVLFFMLRRDCLLGHEIRMCAQRDCGRWFKVERGGQRFCSEECSQHQRQREYWARRGKKMRRLRVARKGKEKSRK
jgi:hypothetical protein